MRILEDFRNTVFDKSRDSIHLAKINSCAIALWNISVALRSGKKTNNIINAKGTLHWMKIEFLDRLHIVFASDQVNLKQNKLLSSLCRLLIYKL